MLSGAMAPADAPGGREVRCVTSLARGYAPKAGLQEEPYEWRDLLDDPPPSRRGRGEGRYAVYHGAEGLGDARVAYLTLVGVRGDVIEVNGRILVRRPLLFEAMDWERRWGRRMEANLRARVHEKQVMWGIRSRGLPAPLDRAYLHTLRAGARALLALVQFLLSAFSAAVAVPDRAYSRMEGALNFLASPVGRRELWRGVRNPSVLTPFGKSIVLASTVLTLTLSLVLVNSVFSLFPGSRAALAWGAIYSLISWGVLTALVLPTPYEVNLFLASIILGVPLTVVVGVAAKILGGWMVFFLGDLLSDYVERAAGQRKWTARLVRRVRAAGSVYGPFAMGAFLAIPFWPETFTLYLFGSLNPPMRRFLAAIAIGMTLRFWLYFTGLDAVADLLGRF